MSVGTGLKIKGHEVYIHDEKLSLIPLDYKYYGFGPTSPEYSSALEAMQMIRRYNPTAKIIIGGPYATINSEACLKDGWDCVVWGDGEISAERAFLGDEKFIKGESSPLDQYPTPDRSLFDLKKYKCFLEGRRATTLVTSRGCPNRCGFCLVRGTLILTADLRWIPIETVKIGDLLLSTEPVKDKSTKYVTTKVTETFNRKTLILKIVTDKGTVFSSGEHPWLTTHNRWREADKLKVGQYLRNVSPPSKTLPDSENYMKGYLVGCIEGDGCLQKYSINAAWPQNKEYDKHFFRLVGDYEMLDWFLKFANKLGINVFEQKFNGGKIYKCDRAVGSGKKSDFEKIEKLFGTEETSEFKRGWLAGFYDAEGGWTTALRFHNQDFIKLEKTMRYLHEQGFVMEVEDESIRIKGGLPEDIRFLAYANPKVKNKKKYIYTKHLSSKAKILSIEDIEGEVETFNLETSSHNFIADGFVTHNCTKNYSHVRLLPAERVIEEIDILYHKFGYRALLFPEDIFIVNRKRAEKVCEHLKKLDIVWRCLVRGDYIVKFGLDFVRMMKDSGLVEVGMGVESGSNKILKIINKGETVEDIKESIRMLKSCGVRIKGFFIIGLPGETHETLAETTAFLDEMQLEDIDAKIFQPYPGSPIWENKESYDIDWSDQDQSTTFYKGRPQEYYGHIRTSALSTEDIYKAWVKIEAKYKRFFPPVCTEEACA
jgi:radical SAM superfamily enzyme YgiQ (UPF0313 family)